MAAANVDSMEVVFDSLNDYFTSKEDVTCSYALSSSFTSSSSTSDWIGLYKVGWQSPNDYYTFEWAPKADTANKASVTFKAKRLPPENDTESYQFCYVSQKKSVLGVSATFRFGTAPHDEDDELEQLEIEEDDAFGSLVVIRSKTADELETAREEASRLQSVQLQTATERDALKERLFDVESERELTGRRIEEVRAENDVLASKLESARENAETMKREVEEWKGKVGVVENRAEVLDGEVKSLQASLAIVQLQANQMKTNYEAKDNEVDVFKGRIVELESDKKKLGDRLAKADETVEEWKAEKILAQDELERGREEVARLRSELALQEEELRVAKEHADTLTMGLADAKGDREGYVDRIRTLEGEAKSLESQLDMAQQEANVTQENMIELLGSQDEMKRELEMAQAEIAGLREGQNGVAAASGAAVALRVAHKQLEREAVELRRERDMMKRDLIESRKREQVLKKQAATLKSSKGGSGELARENDGLKEQIADLTRRLQMGADVYKEKFKECHELEMKLKKLEKGGGRLISQHALQKDMEEADESVETAKRVLKSREEQIETLKDKVRVLEAELALKDADPSFVHVSSEANSITEQMTAELRERRETEEELRECVRKLEADAAEREELFQENDGLRARLTEITDRLGEAERSNGQLRSRLDESDSTVAQQMQKIDELQQDIAALRGSRV